MTDESKDIEDMIRIASSLVLNIGTLNERTIGSMILAGKEANDAGIPVILDPVGAGATKYRTEAVWKILDNVNVSIIKGNEGEIGNLAGKGGKVIGVDSASSGGIDAALELSERTGTVVSMTGKVDVVSNGRRTFTIYSGHDLMSKVSGTGCMASSVTGCYAGVSEDMLTSAVSALAVFSAAGEMAAQNSAGPGTFKQNLFDAMHNITRLDVTIRCEIKDITKV